MFAHRPLAAILTVLGILLTSPTSVSAGFLSVSGGGNILDPATTPTGATRDFFNDRGADRLVHAWNEQQDVTLDRDLFVDLVHPAACRRDNDLGYFQQNKIAKGSVVSSHLLYFDPKKPNQVRNVVFTFDAPIVGLIVGSDRFYNRAHNFTDSLMASDFLGNPLTDYPTKHFEDRGLELDGHDRFTFSVSGNRLILNLTASTPGDQIRVITAQSPGAPGVSTVPAPAGVLLALAGGACLGLGRLIRRRSR